jgi:cell division protein FtsI (penicillin-binding protein 3)
LDVKKDILIRTYLVYLLIIGLGIAIAGKAIYIQQVQGQYWCSMADSAHTRMEQLDAERGSIYAEDGSVLSTSIPEFDIYVDFGAEGLVDKGGRLFRENVDSLSICLANMFSDKGADAYQQELQRCFRDGKHNRYYLLKRRISFQQWEQMKHFPLVRLGKNKSGFMADVRMKRLNPFRLFANRTIGLARDSNKVGLEKKYDYALKGESGERVVRYIAGGAAIPIDGSDVEPKDGHDIVTTLDVAIQDIAEQALYKMMVENECDHGTCIVMEVKTGKIKAMANLGRQKDGSYWEDNNYALVPTEPGSTFKLATMISVLEDGYVNINTPVNLEGGTWQVGNRKVIDAEQHGLYQTTVQHAFEESSNVGMAKLAYMNYSSNPTKFIQHLHALRYDTLTGIDLPFEGKPTIHTPKSKQWSNITLPWMGFGYSLAVSPLQTLTLYNAVANQGRMMKPYLVNAVMKDGEIVENYQPQAMVDKICSDATLQQLYTCLEGVVLNGTAVALKTPVYRFGGKTGTSLVSDGKVKYADNVYQSSFAGFFPLEDPQYSCIVVIRNKPHAAKFYGGSVAGPVFREVADKLYGMKVQQSAPVITADSSLYQFTSVNTTVKKLMQNIGMRWRDSATGNAEVALVATNKNNLLLKGIRTGDKAMPYIKGMALKDALLLCETAGLRPVIKGQGRVTGQSILPGAIVKKGQTINIELN